MSTPLMLRQMRHDVWATDVLVKQCRTLTSEQLELTVPGTFGTILKTLGHIVAADEGYLVRVLGELFHEPPFRLDHEITLDEVATHLEHVRAGVERLYARGDPEGDRLIADTPARRPTDPRMEMFAWVPLTQFVHHGSDHRAQIGTILGANGLATPDVQVWPMAMEQNAVRKAD